MPKFFIVFKSLWSYFYGASNDDDVSDAISFKTFRRFGTSSSSSSNSVDSFSSAWDPHSSKESLGNYDTSDTSSYDSSKSYWSSEDEYTFSNIRIQVEAQIHTPPEGLGKALDNISPVLSSPDILKCFGSAFCSLSFLASAVGCVIIYERSGIKSLVLGYIGDLTLLIDALNKILNDSDTFAQNIKHVFKKDYYPMELVNLVAGFKDDLAYQLAYFNKLVELSETEDREIFAELNHRLLRRYFPIFLRDYWEFEKVLSEIEGGDFDTSPFRCDVSVARVSSAPNNLFSSLNLGHWGVSILKFIGSLFIFLSSNPVVFHWVGSVSLLLISVYLFAIAIMRFVT